MSPLATPAVTGAAASRSPPSSERTSQLLRLPGAVCDADISTLRLAAQAHAWRNGALQPSHQALPPNAIHRPLPISGNTSTACKGAQCKIRSLRLCAVPAFDEMLPMTLFCCAAACRPLGRA